MLYLEVADKQLEKYYYMMWYREEAIALSKNRKKYLKLQYYRKKYGYIQSDVAVLLGISTSAYSHKENGLSAFTFDEIKLIHSVINKKATKSGDALLTLEEIFLD